MAHALWRKRNFQTFRIAKRARERMIQIHEAMVEDPSSDRSIEFEKVFSEKCRAAEDQARKELGEQYGLVELAEEATIDHLMKELDAQARLDAVIDRCIRRLLLVRGLKSISTGSTSTSLASFQTLQERSCVRVVGVVPNKLSSEPGSERGGSGVAV